MGLQSQTWLSEWTTTKFSLNWRFSCGPVVMQETQEMWVWSLGREDSLVAGMATHSSILAWRVPRTELEDYSPYALLRVEHDSARAQKFKLNHFIFEMLACLPIRFLWFFSFSFASSFLSIHSFSKHLVFYLFISALVVWDLIWWNSLAVWGDSSFDFFPGFLEK